MAKITTLFWDVGGVLLSNGWDRRARQAAAEHFELDFDLFEDRHELVATEFEKGRLSLGEYLSCTVFYEARSFDRSTFRDFMFQQSARIDGTIEVAASIASRGRHLMATLNNESTELNRYRIDTFGLREHFTVFFSSCYLGLHKPQVAMYDTALHLTQKAPAECLMIDDRPLNLEGAKKAGLHTLKFRGAEHLRNDLADLGIFES